MATKSEENNQTSIPNHMDKDIQHGVAPNWKLFPHSTIN